MEFQTSVSAGFPSSWEKVEVSALALGNIQQSDNEAEEQILSTLTAHVVTRTGPWSGNKETCMHVIPGKVLYQRETGHVCKYPYLLKTMSTFFCL